MTCVRFALDGENVENTEDIRLFHDLLKKSDRQAVSLWNFK